MRCEESQILSASSKSLNKFEVCSQPSLYLATKYLLLLSSHLQLLLLYSFLEHQGPIMLECSVYDRAEPGISKKTFKGKIEKPKRGEEKLRLKNTSLKKRACLSIPSTIRPIPLKHYICEVTPMLKNFNGSPKSIG